MIVYSDARGDARSLGDASTGEDGIGRLLGVGCHRIWLRNDFADIPSILSAWHDLSYLLCRKTGHNW